MTHDDDEASPVRRKQVRERRTKRAPWEFSREEAGGLVPLGAAADKPDPTFVLNSKRREEEIRRDLKLIARKQNEHIKMLGSLVNSFGAACIGAALIAPAITGRAVQYPGFWLIVGSCLCLTAQGILRLIKSEDP